MSKVCSKCKREYSSTLEFFYKEKRVKDGLTSWCKGCYKEYTKQWSEKNWDYYKKRREKNRGKIKEYKKKWHKNNPDYSKKYHLKRNFGLTLKTYKKMFIKQKGRCGICGRHQSEFKKDLTVHHIHKTNEVRGLLCSNCNRALGLLKHNPFILIKSIKYLKKSKK